MTMNAPDFFESLSIADCLAQKFAGLYPDREQNARWRVYGRGYVIAGLRWLWRNGDADTRTTIAARVAVWRKRPGEYVSELQRRVKARETARKGGS